MAGFATDTCTTTYIVTLPDGQTVKITDESDGCSDPIVTAVLSSEGAPDAALTCHVTRDTLIDGITPYGEGSQAQQFLIEAQNAGLIGDDDWEAAIDGSYYLVDFGDGHGTVDFTAEQIVAKLHPDAGFFNRKG